MTTITVDRGTSNYWKLIQSATKKEKLTLIALLSHSLAEEEGNMAVETRSLKARRLNVLTTEQMDQLITGEPLPLTGDDSDCLSDIVDANQGKIVKGLEKWL